MVFNEHVMRERLPKTTYKQLMKTIKEGEPLDDRGGQRRGPRHEGVGHREGRHPLHPLVPAAHRHHRPRSTTASSTPCGDGRAIMSFSGKELIQGEPDASSFPSGGLRATFEARGYTAWDPTSYAFIKDEVLCIPTAFCSYTGEALDKKTPLLRSMNAVEEQAQPRARAVRRRPRQRVVPTVGAEQEYFLISEKDYAEAPATSCSCGRTLFGYRALQGPGAGRALLRRHPPHGERVHEGARRRAVEAGRARPRRSTTRWPPPSTSWRPSSPTPTAPSTRTCSPWRRCSLLASHHGLVCLQHEKPFEGINGSGKHNNWSLSAGRTQPARSRREPHGQPALPRVPHGRHPGGRRLPGAAAHVGGLGRQRPSSRRQRGAPGHRVHLPGRRAGRHRGRARRRRTSTRAPRRSSMDLGVDVLPNFLKDNTDRNRTSPFAFTGNKFEFRMPGSAREPVRLQHGPQHRHGEDA